MPYKSQAQERWAHTPAGKKALGAAGVAEFDAASKGMKLPERAKPKQKRKTMNAFRGPKGQMA